MFEKIQVLFIFGPGPRFDHIAHRRAGLSSVLESSCIVRPVKKDWAVLSKDTPLDISIYKSVRQSVFMHL